MTINYLKNQNLSSFKGIACDNNFYYVTILNYIYKLNQEMEIIKEYKVSRFYNQICFDDIDNCFYALCDTSPHKIFKLDQDFYEVDFIILPHYVRGIHFFNNKIYYIDDYNIFSIDKHHNMKFIHAFNQKMPISILFTDDLYSVCLLSSNKYIIEIYDYNHIKTSSIKLPQNYMPTQFFSRYFNQKPLLLSSKSSIYSYIISDIF